MVEETSDYGDLRQRDDESNGGGGRTGPSSTADDDHNNNGQSSRVDRTNAAEFDRQQRVTRQSKRRKRRPSSLPPPPSSSSPSCRKSRSRSRMRVADDRTAGNETDDNGDENAAAGTDKDDDKCGGAVDTDEEQQPDEDRILKSVKSLFFNTVENDFQCPICNEMIVKTCTANCGHAFCRNCIKRWIKINKNCPVCRGPVRAITNCIPVDTFITNICEIIGGAVKEERDKLLKERIPGQAVRRKRKRLRSPDVHNH